MKKTLLMPTQHVQKVKSKTLRLPIKNCAYNECQLPITNYQRRSKKFCSGACRKAYYDKRQKVVFGDLNKTIRYIKQFSKTLRLLYDGGTVNTSLTMLEKIGFRRDSALIPVINNKGFYIFSYGDMRLTVDNKNDDAIISTR